MTVHLIPMDDWIDHRSDCSAEDCDCLCCPTRTFVDDVGAPLSTSIVIHNPIDGRIKSPRELADWKVCFFIQNEREKNSSEAMIYVAFAIVVVFVIVLLEMFFK